MEKTFKIELPEVQINEAQREKETKAKFHDDFEKGGWLAQTFIFTHLNSPASVTEIADALSKYYKREFDRTSTFRVLNRLVKLGLLHTTTSGYVIALPANERKDIHNEILVKYHRFLSPIPEPFRKRYTEMHYFWLSNGEGLKYIPFCCKTLGFKCEEKNDRNQSKKN